MLGDLKVVVKTVPRSRSVSVRVLPNGSVVVTAPRFTPRFVINQFVAKHEDWIREKQGSVVEKLNALVAEREKLFFRGLEYDFRLSISPQKEGVKITDSILTVTAVREDHAQVRRILEKWYRAQAAKHFKERVPLLADLVDSTVKTVSIRSQRTRWGSCSSRNTISLNWRLIMAPDWVSDYVIYHELAHLTHMNHSKDFWQLVERYVPNHKDAQKWLKDHHALLQF
ncbi:MAG: M48 family metallopeptidase [Candidatus Berkelbacteria bacterium]|nr:M48 family metallopeptidase [Candidatus Berkelbacteria bacterium]MCR4307328.1 M48 family metallopeptidase [Candidatus Berkelbacteria bacterium]